MSRRSRGRRRAYQPYPARHANWTARFVIIGVIALLILTAVAVTVGQ